MFEKELCRYDAESLILCLYEFLAQSSHDYFIHTARFNLFDGLADDEKERIEQSSVENREEARTSVRALRYTIEYVLSFGLSGDEIAQEEELNTLVSLACEVVALADAADMLHFDSPKIGIEVAENSRVFLTEDDELREESKKLRVRQLSDSGHFLEAKDDEPYIAKAKDAFLQDTGINFECFLDVLEALAFYVVDEEATAQKPNVFIGSKESIISFLVGAFGDYYEPLEISSCLDFLLLDISHLRTVKGKNFDYLPFGRMKDRPNRLELRPIIPIKGKWVFSPVEMGVLRDRWVRGFAERFIPAKASFESTYQIMQQWKRHYEKSLEKETYSCFIENGMNPNFVFKNLSLHKKGNHPQYLGDFDVLAYNEEASTLWIVECKEFEKVESSYDYMQLQVRWFGEKGKLKKFDRRIEYVNNHLSQIMQDLCLPYSEETQVNPILVCNKLFLNVLNESSFNVITLNELNALLAQERVNHRS